MTRKPRARDRLERLLRLYMPEGFQDPEHEESRGLAPYVARAHASRPM